MIEMRWAPIPTDVANGIVHNVDGYTCVLQFREWSPRGYVTPEWQTVGNIVPLITVAQEGDE